MNVNMTNTDNGERYRYVAKLAKDTAKKYEYKAELKKNLKIQKALDRKKKRIKQKLAMLDAPRSIEEIVAEILSDNKLSTNKLVAELRAAVMTKEAISKEEQDEILIAAGYPVSQTPVTVSDVAIPNIDVEVDVETELTLSAVTPAVTTVVGQIPVKPEHTHSNNNSNKKRRK